MAKMAAMADIRDSTTATHTGIVRPSAAAFADSAA